MHRQYLSRALARTSLAALVIGAAACATSTETKSVSGTGETAQTEKKLSDAEISAVVNAANLGEIEEAQLAKTLAASEEVRAYADMMIRDHTAANDRHLDLARRLGIVPLENKLSKELADNTKSTIESLREKKGEEFDRAYIDAQVKTHERVLEIIIEDLLPNATHPDLAADVREMRPAVESHLTEAKRIRDRPVASN